MEAKQKNGTGAHAVAVAINKTWKDRIAQAKKCGKFTYEDIELARQWGSCAIGEKFHLAQGDSYDVEKFNRLDKDLNHAISLEGSLFSIAVASNHIEVAERVFNTISSLPNPEEAEEEEEEIVISVSQ